VLIPGLLASAIGGWPPASVLAFEVVDRVVPERPHDHSVTEIDYHHAACVPACSGVGWNGDLAVPGDGHDMRVVHVPIV
jgi:hypothetical protein